MNKKKQGGGSRNQIQMDLKDQGMDIKSIMKDIKLLGSSHMTWKERKELENKKVVSLGGKPQKKQRLPLSVARVTMKKQKESEQKTLHENMILGRFGGEGRLNGGTRKVEKRKPEDRVLKPSEGYFRNGVLDVKHLLQTAPKESGASMRSMHNVFGGKKKSGGNKNRGKKKGRGKKCR